MRTPKRFSISKCLSCRRAMLDARFSHLYFCQRLPTLQRGLSSIADLLVPCTPISCQMLGYSIDVVVAIPNCSFPFTYNGELYYGCITGMTGVSTNNQPFACINVNATPVVCGSPGWSCFKSIYVINADDVLNEHPVSWCARKTLFVTVK